MNMIEKQRRKPYIRSLAWLATGASIVGLAGEASAIAGPWSGWKPKGQAANCSAPPPPGYTGNGTGESHVVNPNDLVVILTGNPVFTFNGYRSYTTVHAEGWPAGSAVVSTDVPGGTATSSYPLTPQITFSRCYVNTY